MARSRERVLAEVWIVPRDDAGESMDGANGQDDFIEDT